MTIKVFPKWNALRDRIKAATGSYGKKSELACELGVSRQVVNAWLSGAGVPNAEHTLQLLEWVKAIEAKQNQAPGSVITTAKGRKTRSSKPLQHEKTRSSPPKR